VSTILKKNMSIIMGTKLSRVRKWGGKWEKGGVPNKEEEKELKRTERAKTVKNEDNL